MTDKVAMYLIYLALSLVLTAWVARVLSRNGAVFLEDALSDERLARSVNQLLVVGFYLLNVGYVAFAMRDDTDIVSAAGVLEQLSRKLGLVLLVLGVMHFVNLFLLGRYRRTRMRAASGQPPLAPVAVLPPPLTPAQSDRIYAQMRAQHEAALAAQRTVDPVEPPTQPED